MERKECADGADTRQLLAAAKMSTDQQLLRRNMYSEQSACRLRLR